MGLANFIRRGLNGIARRDPQDRFKSWVLVCARVAWALGVGSRSRSSVSEFARRRAVVKLAQYAFPSWDTPIVVIGRQAEALAAALRAAGYERCRRIESPRELEAPADGGAKAADESTIVVIVDYLEWLSDGQLDGFLDQVQRAMPARIVASIPTYPECIWDKFKRASWPSIFERRLWWWVAFRRREFEAEVEPRENLPGLTPYIFRARKQPTRQTEMTERPTGPVTFPLTVFVMPEIENAFRWVTESLAAALARLDHPARVVRPEFSDMPPWPPGPKRIGWAHYWREYGESASIAKPNFEVFVTNFEMTRRGDLTPWVAELCARPSTKLAVSNYCRDVLVGLGVPEDRVHVVPHGYSPEFATPPPPLPLATRKRFRFLAVVNSHDPYRYGTDILLTAYRKAFRRTDDVCLVIKDYGANAAATQTWFEDSGGPEILYYANFLEKADLAAFYAACSAFVAPFRGEGFGMKILDAAVLGLPLIVPLYGGPLDYCVPELVQPVAFERRPVGKCLDTDQIRWNEEITWCEPSVDDLAARMRSVFENQTEATEKAARLRPIAMEQFSWEAAARKLLAIIE